MLSRTTLTFAALATFGAGCSLINAYDDVVSSGGGGVGAQGGAGGSTSSTMSTGSTMGGGGMGGGGGMPPTYACQPFQNPVEVLSPADLDNTMNLDETVSVFFDVDGYTHVMATNHDTRQIVLRTVRDAELGPLVKYPANPTTQDNQGFGIFATGNSVRVLARVDGQFSMLQYMKGGGEITPSAPTLTPLNSSARCNAPAQHDRLYGTLDGGSLWAAGMCRNNNTNELTTFGLDVGANLVRFEFTGAINDPTMRVSQYTRVNGINVLFTSGENPGAAFLRAGPDGTVSNMAIPLQVAQDKVPFPFAVVPGIGPTPSVFALIASLSPMAPYTPATLLAGVVDAQDVANLAMTMPLLQPALEFTSQSGIQLITPPNQAYGRFVSAGVNLFDPGSSRVTLQWWDPEGHLLTSSVINEIADPANDGRHTFAVAGRGNQVFYYVVWAVQDAGSRFHVFGQRASCDQVTSG